MSDDLNLAPGSIHAAWTLINAARSRADWDACLDPDTTAPDHGRRVFVGDTSDGWIGIAGIRDDQRVHVELIGRVDPGNIADELRRLIEKHGATAALSWDVNTQHSADWFRQALADRRIAHRGPDYFSRVLGMAAWLVVQRPAHQKYLPREVTAGPSDFARQQIAEQRDGIRAMVTDQGMLLSRRSGDPASGRAVPDESGVDPDAVIVRRLVDAGIIRAGDAVEEYLRLAYGLPTPQEGASETPSDDVAPAAAAAATPAAETAAWKRPGGIASVTAQAARWLAENASRLPEGAVVEVRQDAADAEGSLVMAWHPRAEDEAPEIGFHAVVARLTEGFDRGLYDRVDTTDLGVACSCECTCGSPRLEAPEALRFSVVEWNPEPWVQLVAYSQESGS